MKDLWNRFVAWVRRMLHLYEKEIREFVNDILDLAYQNLDNRVIDKLTPAIRRKVTNKVIAEILINGIDIATIQGKSAVSAMVLNYIREFTKEGE